MRFTILITAAISVLAFVSQSASALSVQDSHRELSQLSKRQPGPGVLGSRGDTDLSGEDGEPYSYYYDPPEPTPPPVAPGAKQ
jgi:hypothetical protein